MTHTTSDYYPMRKIVGRRYYEPKSAPHGTGSVELTLECGHSVHRKQSAEPKHQTRCEDCFYDQSTR